MTRTDRRGEPRLVDPATHPRRYVTLGAAAVYLEIDRRTLNKYLDEGLLACVRYNGRRRLEVAELLAFDRRQRTARARPCSSVSRMGT